MSVAYVKRSDDNKITVTAGQTLGDVLTAASLTGKLDLVAQYNWGTKDPVEINRALVELVGCTSINDDPLLSVLDPARGTKHIHNPLPWKPELAVGKTHTIKIKKRQPATAVAITELTALFNPASETCTVKCRYEGSRADKRDFEVHASAYYSVETIRGEIVEKASGTDDVTKPENTHVFRSSAGGSPGPETISWDGTSTATQGVLKSGAKINSACAPYTVLVRYYKDDKDKTASIKQLQFYPRWTVTAKATYTIDEKSLVVKWKLQGEETSKAKLKAGQLSIHDKDGVVVFFCPLTALQIAGGKYDLLAGPVKWDKTKLDRAKMPYRVQIQAHSDSDEDNGLALAAMPTQVPAYNYEQVQLIGFNVRNDTNNADTAYLGSGDADTDIDKRCEVLIEAIQKAKLGADADRKILKVFVAPEFYFRGSGGAYPVEKISTIVPKMRAETDKFEYLDWLFVFGTAIGQLKHGTTAAPVELGEAVHAATVASVNTPANTIKVRVWQKPAVGWTLKSGTRETAITVVGAAGTTDATEKWTEYEITVASATGIGIGAAKIIEPQMTIRAIEWHTFTYRKEMKVKSSLFARIPVDPGTKQVLNFGNLTWKAKSGSVDGKITKVVYDSATDEYEVTAYGSFEKGKPLKLIEPVATEVFNVALVQKGWFVPNLGRGLEQVITYKENISPIDFIRDKVGHTDWHDATGVNREITIHGEQHRRVLPTDGSADLFGADANVTREVDSAAGSEINLSGVGGGCVFTIDNVTFGLEVCLDHAKYRLHNFYNGTNKKPGDPQVQVQLIPSWGMSIGGGSTAGREVTCLANGLVFNVDGSRMESVARVNDGDYYCDNHIANKGLSGATCAKAKFFLSAAKKYIYCREHGRHIPGGCTDASHHAIACGKPFRKMGKPLTASSTTNVPKSKDATYFHSEVVASTVVATTGQVLVFPATALPSPDVVT